MLHMNKILYPPTQKPPRVSVPVAPEVLVIFERLAKASNMSTGRVMAEWLRDTGEAAELMASVMERARSAPKVVTAELHAMMLGMADQTKELADKYAKFAKPGSDDMDRHAVRAAVTGFAGLSKTPPSNTGVTSTTKNSPNRGNA